MTAARRDTESHKVELHPDGLEHLTAPEECESEAQSSPGWLEI